MRVLVTGSRDWEDWWAVDDALTKVLYGMKPGGTLTVVHGKAWTGADEMANHWVTENRPFSVRDHGVTIVEEDHPADWKAWGKSAGMIRNQFMVNKGADLCLAFISRCVKENCPKQEPHGSHGASHCLRLAQMGAKIPTIVDKRGF